MRYLYNTGSTELCGDVWCQSVIVWTHRPAGRDTDTTADGTYTDCFGQDAFKVMSVILTKLLTICSILTKIVLLFIH